MPSIQPRLALTLPGDLRTVLEDLATELDKPMSTVVTEFLNELKPQLIALTKLTHEVKAGNKAAATKVLQHMVGDSLAQVLSEQHQRMGLYDRLNRKV